MTHQKPSITPQNSNFSSGPCAKRPGWSVDALNDALLGRSHRSKPGKEKLKTVIDMHRALLGIPDDYKIGIVPASDTGAFEMALWSMAGARGIDVFAWESFGAGWAADIQKHLKLTDVNRYDAPYGSLPDLTQADFSRDIVFTWNGTTSGVRVPNGDWIADNRTGLTMCDATSAVFAYDMPWDKLDVTTWSWQKILGGEGAHGMIVLSPKAVERLESYTPPWPLPKIFRLTKGGNLNESIFEGATINTPSMMAVEDCIDALQWVDDIGGLPACIRRSHTNFNLIDHWVRTTPWVDFLAAEPATRSTTSVCLTLQTPDSHDPVAFAKQIVTLLDAHHAARDIGHYRDAPAGLRIWCGATIEPENIETLLPWIEWAYHECRQD